MLGCVHWISTLPKEGKNVFEGCATCNELISTSSDISVFQSMLQKYRVLKDAGLGKKMLWLKQRGKWHFGRVTEHMSTKEVYRKLCHSPTSISQYYHEDLKKNHAIPSNNQSSCGKIFEMQSLYPTRFSIHQKEHCRSRP